MKHSWQIACQCGKVITLEAVGTQRFPSIHCPACGSTIVPIDDELIHMRLFNRGFTELQGGDCTLAIVFGAMAVECYVAYLYLKWKRIDVMPTTMQPSQADEDSWAEQLRKWNNVGARFDKVCDFLTTETFDSFVANNSALAKTICQRHPESSASTSPKQFFQDNLFSKRNKIVHHGKLDYDQPEATACVEAARTLLEVFGEMDRKRYKDLMARLQ